MFGRVVQAHPCRPGECPDFFALLFFSSMFEGCWVRVVLLLALWGQNESGQAMAITSACRSIWRYRLLPHLVAATCRTRSAPVPGNNGARRETAPPVRVCGF